VVAYVLRRAALASGVLLLVSYATFVFVATQFSATCASEYTPTGAFPPLADGVGHASTLYLRWLKGIPSGDSFGSVCGGTVTQDLGPALGHTGALLGMTLVLVVALSLLFGVLAAARAGTWLDLAFRAFSYTAWAVPPFLLALFLQSVLGWLARDHGFRFFPKSGWPGACAFGTFCFNPDGSPLPPGPGGWAYAGDVIRFLVVPSLALAVAFVGMHSRFLRSSLVVSLGAPYTTTARAKGLSERRIVMRHALRNSLGVFTSVLLLDFGAIVGAALAVDYVFKLNGLGLLFLSEIGALGSQSGDGPKFLDPYAVQGLLAVVALLVAVASLLAELAVLWLDPRARPA
jgi:peptide/nickel transport system permease protein